MSNNATFLGEKDENGMYKTYSSFNSELMEEKKKFFNAISSPESLATTKGSIDLQHVYLEQVVYKNKEVKEGEPEEKDGIRLILIDKNMKGFKTSSIGVLNALIRMETVAGSLPWTPTQSVISKKNATSNGQNIRILDFAT